MDNSLGDIRVGGDRGDFQDACLQPPTPIMLQGMVLGWRYRGLRCCLAKDTNSCEAQPVTQLYSPDPYTYWGAKPQLKPSFLTIYNYFKLGQKHPIWAFGNVLGAWVQSLLAASSAIRNLGSSFFSLSSVFSSIGQEKGLASL